MPFGSESYGTPTYGEGEYDLTRVNVSVDVEFTAGTWTDVLALRDVRSVSTNRGRNSQFVTFSAGRAAVVLDNRDRAFDPTYVDGPYYPNVKPLRRFRVRADWGGVTYYLFTGYVDALPQEYRNPSDGFVPLTATDAFKILATAENPQPYLTLDNEFAGYLDQAVLAGPDDPAAELTGARIEKTLLGVGMTDYNLDAGRTTLPAGQATGPALPYLQDIAVSEDGRLFVAGNGDITFLDRHAPFLDTASNTSQATFGDGPGELPYRDITLTYDDTQIRNHVNVRMTADDGKPSEISREDDTSIDEYGRQTYSISVLFADPDEAEDRAEYALWRYKDPFLRVESIVINPFRSPEVLLPQVLGREIGDRITIKRRPQGVGDPIVLEALIEGVSHSFSPGSTWTTTWTLSPADTRDVLVLDDAALGLLDTAPLSY